MVVKIGSAQSCALHVYKTLEGHAFEFGLFCYQTLRSVDVPQTDLRFIVQT